MKIFNAINAENIEELNEQISRVDFHNVRNSNNMTPLMAATRKGSLQMTKILLDAGADPNFRGSNSETAISYATAPGHTAIVNLLLDYGATPNPQDSDFTHSPLFEALENAHWETAEVLIDRGADASWVSRDNESALTYAIFGSTQRSKISEKCYIVIEKILESGVNPNLVSSFNSSSPMKIAVGDGSAELVPFVKLLLKFGAVPITNHGSPSPEILEVLQEAKSKREEASNDIENARNIRKDIQIADTVFYIFDYNKMDSNYGLQAFNYINSQLIQSKGTCVFCHGDLEVYSGGPSAIPKFLRQLASQGSVLPNVSHDQLVQLDTISHIYAYAISMWTDSKENILNLHERLVESDMSYLGAITMSDALGSVATFFSEMNRFLLPPAITFKNGAIIADSNRVGLKPDDTQVHNPAALEHEVSTVTEDNIAENDIKIKETSTNLLDELVSGESLAATLAHDMMPMPTNVQFIAMSQNKDYMNSFLNFFHLGESLKLKKKLIRKLHDTPQEFRREVAAFMTKECGDASKLAYDRSFRPYLPLFIGLLLWAFPIYASGRQWEYNVLFDVIMFIGGVILIILVGPFIWSQSRLRKFYRKELPHFNDTNSRP